MIALLALAAAASATYRVFQQEQQLVSDVTKSHEGELSAESAIQSIGDLKAALHAYVAAGQNHSFWTTRAAMFLDKTRTSLLELDGAASAAGSPVTETIGLLDKVAASEKRARNYVRVKFQAEDPDAEPARSLMSKFNSIGLPTYVILRPKAAAPARSN